MFVVEGMKISDFNCEIVVGKMMQYRNRALDERATASLELVHCDLSGPIDPVAREGYKYAISFIEDYVGINTTYFLKSKSDGLAGN